MDSVTVTVNTENAPPPGISPVLIIAGSIGVLTLVGIIAAASKNKTPR